MYRSTRITRTLATVGGGAVVSLVLCFPAGAADDDGAPVGVDVGAAKHGGIEAPSAAPSPVDVGAAKHGGIDSPSQTVAPTKVDVGRMLNDIDSTTTRPEKAQSSTIPAATGDDSLEYDQIVLGALGGATLAGVSVFALRRRGAHHSPMLT